MKRVCDRPVSSEALVALLSGDDELDEADLESHLFYCTPCGDEWMKLASLVGGLRATIPMVISHAYRERLVASGKRISVVDVPIGVATPARFTPEVDLLVFALKADFAGVDRLRVDIVSPDGSKRFVEEDVPFDPARGMVLVACQRHYEGMFESDPTFEVHAMNPTRRLASYRVLHAWR